MRRQTQLLGKKKAVSRLFLREALVFVIRHLSGKTNVPIRLKAEGSSLGRVSSRGSTRLVPAYSTQFAKCVTRCTGARTETEVCACTSPAVAIFPTEAPRLPYK